MTTSKETRIGNLPTGRLVARNATLNFGGECVSVLVGLASIPFIVRGLGTERLGVLSLAWLLLVYFTLFDVGLARATTKLASEALGRGEDRRLPAIIGTTLSLQSGLGVLGGLCMAGCVPLLVSRVLRIPLGLKVEAMDSFWILCALIPVLLATNSLRGTLEALQRFDLVNYVKIPTSASMFVLPLILLQFRVHLPGIILSIAVFRIGALVALFFACLRSLPVGSRNLAFLPEMSRTLFSYGGWVTISNVTGPILTYVDRFMVASLVSMSAVAYYGVPADMVGRFLIVPASLAATLFPALSSLDGAGIKPKVEEFYARSLKCMVLILGPALALVAAFAGSLLTLWLGPDFAQKSAFPLQVLAAGVFINALAFFPFSLLQGVNRPDLTGIFHLIELPIQVAIAWILVSRFGILGAAAAWTLRPLIDATLLFGACWRLRIVSRGAMASHGVSRSLYATFLLAAILIGIVSCGANVVPQIVFACLALACYYLFSWHFVLDFQDRGFLTVTLRAVKDGLTGRGKVGAHGYDLPPTIEVEP
jgi:O-antigen/teichoic acid export membrane protein